VTDITTLDKEEAAIRDIDAMDARWFLNYPDQTEYVRPLTFEEMIQFPENHFIRRPLPDLFQSWVVHVKKLDRADSDMVIEKKLIICRDIPRIPLEQ
jgi:hypothetical protein